MQKAHEGISKSVTLSIQVTDSDIKNGTKKRCDLCPIALAVNREFALSLRIHPTNVAVTGLYVMAFDSASGTLYRCDDVPESVREFIKKFDIGIDEVEPQSITLQFKVK